MRLLSKVWKCLLYRDYSTWSPAHGALYKSLLGRRKVVGFEWESRQEGLISNRDLIHLPYTWTTDVGRDISCVEIRIAFDVSNPKWATSLFKAYETMYNRGLLPTGYHVSYNIGIPHTTLGTDASVTELLRRASISKYDKYGRYHHKLFGYYVEFAVGLVKSQPIYSKPMVIQFKPVAGALTPYQVLFDTILRNQFVLGMSSGRLKFNKIEEMARVMLDATPHRLLPLFAYPPESLLGGLLRERL